MGNTFTSFIQFEKMIQPLITEAVEKAASKMCDRLQYFIGDEYYLKYIPMVYKRSYQFLESATTNLLSPTSAEIGMDDTLMNYDDWDGETQLYMADGGFHGSVDIFREGYFWKDYIKWCNDNAIDILEEELRKQGLNIVRN